MSRLEDSPSAPLQGMSDAQEVDAALLRVEVALAGQDETCLRRIYVEEARRALAHLRASLARAGLASLEGVPR